MELLFEDRDITVAVKPAGLLSEITDSPTESFAAHLAQRNEKQYIGVIHRLDRGVGGVMVYARTPRAAARLSAAVQANALTKEYLAVVHGELSSPEDRLCDLLFHDRTRNKSFVVERERRGVKKASLSYHVLGVADSPLYGRISLLLVRLETGRTHQIRVQFSHRGHPLIGDGKYGAHDRCGMALFSHAITLPHPTSGESLHLSALPSESPWTDLLDLFGADIRAKLS